MLPGNQRRPAVGVAAAGSFIHLINPLWDANGGSEWRAIGMYKALAASNPVRLWSRFNPSPAFQRYPV